MPISNTHPILNYQCFINPSIESHPENEVIKTRNLLTRATAHVSFWGTRSIEVTGYKGSLDIKEAAFALKTIISGHLYLSEEGCDRLMSCVLKMRELYLATDTIINNANWFQRLCYAARNFFFPVKESSENSSSLLRSYVECLPSEIDSSNSLKSYSFEEKVINAREEAILRHDQQRIRGVKARELHRFGTFCEQPHQNHQAIREAFYQLPRDSQELVKNRMWRIANRASVRIEENKNPLRDRYLAQPRHPNWNFHFTDPDWAEKMLNANPLPVDLLVAATPTVDTY